MARPIIHPPAFCPHCRGIGRFTGYYPTHRQLRLGYVCTACKSGFSLYKQLKVIDRPLTALETIVRDLYFDGLTMNEIGQLYGITRSRVQQILAGIPGFKKLPWSARIQRHRFVILELHQLGWTASQIAAILGTATIYVSRFLVKQGLTPKTKDMRLGCDKCITNHYALGLCLGCYRRYKIMVAAGQPIEFTPGFSCIRTNRTWRPGKGRVSKLLLSRLKDIFPLPGNAEIERSHGDVRWQIKTETIEIFSPHPMKQCLESTHLNWTEVEKNRFLVLDLPLKLDNSI